MWRHYGRAIRWVLGLTLYKIVESWTLNWIQAKYIDPNTSKGVRLLVEYAPVLTWLIAAAGLVWATRHAVRTERVLSVVLRDLT